MNQLAEVRFFTQKPKCNNVRIYNIVTTDACVLPCPIVQS